MKTQSISHWKGRFASPVGFVLTQCVPLWCVFSFALALLALLEWRFLCERGVEYIPKNSLQQVSVRTFSVSADGQWAASIMSLRRGSFQAQAVDDVVVHDLERQTTRRLFLGDLLPCLVVISPTAESIAIACQDGSVQVTTGQTGSVDSGPHPETTCLLSGSYAEVQCLVFSPDGRSLAVARNREIHLLPVPADTASCSPEEDGFLGTGSQQLGRRHLCASGKSDEVDGCFALRQVAGDRAWTSLAFTADSRQLVMLDCHGEVRWWDTLGGEPVAARKLTNNPAIRTALSADGRIAALALANGTLHCWDLAADEQLWQRNTALVQLYQAFPTAFEISPDGRLLVIAYWTDGKYGIHCYDTGTGEYSESWPRYQTSFKGLTVASTELVYTWDSQAVVRAWNVALGGEQRRFSWVPETDR